MTNLTKIIKLSQKIANSILAGKQPKALEKASIFSKEDKNYILSKLTDNKHIKERESIKKCIDKNHDWKHVEAKIVKPVKKVSYFKYAAVAAILVGVISIGYLKLTNVKQSDSDNAIIYTIEKGVDKAILTLEDGTEIALEKGKEIKTSHAKSNGEQLIYDIKEKDAGELVYNYLTIPRGAHFTIQLADGTNVKLNSETQLKYPVNFVKGESRLVELVYGEAYFDVSHSSEHHGASFKVLNNNEIVEVLGTEFNIKAYKDEAHIYTTLVKGKIAVNIAGKTHLLNPGEQSDFDTKGKSVVIKTVDSYNETSWKDGVFSFDNKSLKEIMKVLSRWYDFDVEYKNNAIKAEEFIGILSKDQKIENILISLKDYGIIEDYEINGKTIILN
ncbi:MAG: anti-sigma factor [Draconibacterium sp.]|nr:MAG: anti-sigma factor [Draconibacterium sp.]